MYNEFYNFIYEESANDENVFLLDEDYEDNKNRILDKTYECLVEASDYKKVTQVHNKQWFMKRLIAQCELELAREADDKYFKKFTRARKTAKKMRGLIHTKYYAKAKVRAKEYLQQRKAKETKKASSKKK